MKELPRTCLLTVTNRCILQCKMCHLWKLEAQEEVSLKDCENFLREMSSMGGGGLEVHLIGGEPLIKEGIFDFIDALSKMGISTVMTSSGYTIDEKIAARIAQSGLKMLNISLDSLDPRTHNFLRGRDDCFEKVMRALGFLGASKAPGMMLGINTILSATNLDDIPGLIRWVQETPYLDTIYFMAAMRPFGSDLGWDWHKRKELDFLWPSDSGKAKRTLDQIIDMKKKGCRKISNPSGQLRIFKSYFDNPEKFIKTRRCNVAQRAVNVNAAGDLYICFFKESLGKIRDPGILGMLTSEKAERIKAGMEACKNNCELVINCYYEEEGPRAPILLARKAKRKILSLFSAGRR